jgi:hypothetical protein
MLSEIEGVQYENAREDIFVITDPDTDLKLVVDVEEETVCLLMDVMKKSEVPVDADFLEFLLKQNNKAVHGAFCLDDRNLLIKENLEFENLDLNELETAIKSIFVLANDSLPTILERVGG